MHQLNRRLSWAFSLLTLLSASSALAHHSAVAFDKEKTVTVTGEVTRFVWRNPHMAIVMAVTGADGRTEEWKIEGPGTTVLSRQGFNRSSIEDGDEITVVVNPLKTGKPGGLMMAITLADGTKHATSEDYAETPAETQRVVQTIPSLLDYVPPPDGETWAR